MSLSRRLSALEGAEGPVIEEKIVMASGDIAYKKYSKGRFLGKGGFAKVYEFVNLETQKVSAAKLIPKASLSKARARQKLMSEIKIHRSLHHSNIVNFEHFFEDTENVYIMLELCTNHTLSELMRRRKRITEIEAKCYTFQVISGLQHLHRHRVIHRDIKLGNLFLSETMEVKLGDFGLATKLEFEGERKRTICGTPNYIAPEILEGKTGHSYEVDIWSLGVLLYTFVVGKPPFETQDVKHTYRRIKMNAYSFPEHVVLSDEVKTLISSILQTDPTQRPTLPDIANHAFFATPFPKQMPSSCLAVPPSSSYLKQYYSRPSHVPRLSSPTEDRSAQPLTSPKAVQPIPSKRMTVTSIFTGTADGPQVWVKKWVDFSSKYGLGYLMSNNQVGVYFNDSTKIISRKGVFQYYQRVGSSREEKCQEYTTAQYPQELKKKVTLLDHFKKYLEFEEEQNSPSACVFIKKWLVTSQAIIFRLSTRVVQVVFQDKSEILLCSDTKRVTYVNTRGQALVYPLKTAGESGNLELNKRLKSTKDVLSKLFHGEGRT